MPDVARLQAPRPQWIAEQPRAGESAADWFRRAAPAFVTDWNRMIQYLDSQRANEKDILPQGLTFTNNSPVSGSVAWTDFLMVYLGETFTVAGGNTANKFIYWSRTNPTVLATSATNPTLGVDDFMVAFNNAGVHSILYTDRLEPGEIQNTHLSTVDAAKLFGAVPGDVTGVARSFAELTGQIAGGQIPATIITTAMIQLAAITTALIQDAAITNAKIGTAAIGTANIQNAAITNALIANLAVATAKIADAAIIQAKIANLAVGTAQIAALAVTDAKINDLSAAKITTGTLDAARIAAGTITTTKLNIRAMMVSGISLTSNSPSAGFIAWNAFTITLLGVDYAIAASNTSAKFVWWDSGNTTLNTGASFTPITGRFLIATNTSGTAMEVWDTLGRSAIQESHLSFALNSSYQPLVPAYSSVLIGASAGVTSVTISTDTGEGVLYNVGWQIQVRTENAANASCSMNVWISINIDGTGDVDIPIYSAQDPANGGTTLFHTPTLMTATAIIGNGNSLNDTVALSWPIPYKTSLSVKAKYQRTGSSPSSPVFTIMFSVQRGDKI